MTEPNDMCKDLESSAQNKDPKSTVDSPLVSVIMPAYNAEKHIARSLKSILGQTYPNVEIIVVDDGSHDDTQTAVSMTAPAATYVRIENSGPAAARNVGSRHAKGDYLAFLDSDDVWHPRKLELQVKYLEQHRDIGVVFCMWCETFPGETEIDWEEKQRFDEPLGLSIMPEKSGWLYADLLLDTMIHTSSVMLRKTLFDQMHGFNETLIIGEDYDLWIRLSRVTEIHKLRATLSAYEQRDDSITQTPQPVPFGATVIRRSLSQWGRRGPDGRAARWFAVRQRIAQSFRNHGLTNLQHGNRKMALWSLLHAIYYDPITSSNWLGMAKAMLKPAGSGRLAQEGNR